MSKHKTKDTAAIVWLIKDNIFEKTDVNVSVSLNRHIDKQSDKKAGSRKFEPKQR